MPKTPPTPLYGISIIPFEPESGIAEHKKILADAPDIVSSTQPVAVDFDQTPDTTPENTERLENTPRFAPKL